jgi:hypothetical protein
MKNSIRIDSAGYELTSDKMNRKADGKYVIRRSEKNAIDYQRRIH